MPRQLLHRSTALARPAPAAVQLRRYPNVLARPPAPQALKSFSVVPVQAQRTQRQYFGRAISLNAIEVALRQAWRGSMRPLTDLSRETLDTDPHLASVVAKRVESLAGLPFEVHPATGYGVDPAKALYYAAVVRDQLANLRNFRASLKQLAWALFDGRSCLELEWIDVDGGRSMGAQRVTMAVTRLGWVHPRRLSFGPYRELRVTDEAYGLSGNFAPYGLVVDDPSVQYRFMKWLPQLFGEYPEREGLAPRCLYWSFFKRFGARERMILLELFGKPWRIVTVDQDSNAGDPELQQADEVVDALGASYTARMPRGTNLTVVQPQRTAGNVHAEVIKESDRQISKLVLGQTGTTDEMKGGMNNQQANVMQDEQLAKLKYDAGEFSCIIEDQLTDAIVAVNFGEVEVIHAPTFILRADLPVSRKEEIERLDGALKAGLVIKRDEAYVASGFSQPDDGDVVIQMEQPPSQPNSPVAPAPRPIILYPQGKSPKVLEQQPLPPVAATEKGSAPPSASGGAAVAGHTITVNEDRAARGLGPLQKNGKPDPDGDLPIEEAMAKRKAKHAPPPPTFLPPGTPPGAPPKPGEPPPKGAQPPTARKPGFPAKAGAQAAQHAAEARTLMADHLGADDLGTVSLAVLTTRMRESSVDLAWLLSLAQRQPTTEHGSPEDLSDRGVVEARRAVAKMAAVLGDAVQGVTTAGGAFTAVNQVRHQLDVHPLARALERRMVQAAALGALDASLMDPQSVQAAAGDAAKTAAPFSRQPYDQALRTFRDRKVMRKPAFAALEAKAKGKAFTVAGLAADEMVATVHDELVRQVSAGADIREFRSAIAQRMKDAGWVAQLQTLGDGSQALSASHVDNVFQTNVMGAYNAGRAAQMSEPGVMQRRPVWQIRTCGDGLVRANHAEGNNVKMLASDGFWQRAYPPFGFRCFVPGTEVQGQFVGASKALYAGQVVELTTAVGRRLTVTANHPVLTARGLVEAQALREGDQLVGYGRQTRVPALGQRAQRHEHYDPAAVEQVFGALAQAGRPLSTGYGADDFHGEAQRFRGQVQVVGSYRHLVRNFHVAVGQQFQQLQLEAPDKARALQSAAPQDFGRLLRASTLSVGGVDLVGAGGWAHLGPLDPLRLGLASQLDTLLPESLADDLPAHAEFVGELLDRSAGAVALDELVSVRKYDRLGHVFDLETKTGWMVAGGILTSNCRCRVVSLPADQMDDVVDGSTVDYLPDPGFTSGLGGIL